MNQYQIRIMQDLLKQQQAFDNEMREKQEEQLRTRFSIEFPHYNLKEINKLSHGELQTVFNRLIQLEQEKRADELIQRISF